MTQLRSVVMGGALAAGFVLAAGANAAQAQMADDTTTWETQTFEANEFDVDGFAGTLNVIVEGRSGIQVDATGPAEKMERLEVGEFGGTVELTFEEKEFRWNDWSTWLGWWRDSDFDVEDYPVVTVRLPAGTPVDVDGMTGHFDLGDLNGPLDFAGAGAIDATIGNLTSADFDTAGAARVHFGDVSGALDISAAGASDYEGGNVSSADISTQGAADVVLARVEGDLDVSTAGMSDIDVAYVNGDVDLSIAGAGNITIQEGRATSFGASIAGAGDVDFHGTAVDPRVSIAGAGDVFIERYEGRLRHSGMGRVDVGSGS